MLQLVVRSLCDRPADTSTQRDDRTRQLVRSLIGLAPRDGLEYMLASMIFGHFEVILDSMHDVFNGQPAAVKARTKSTLVSLDRAMLSLLREMRLARRRPEVREEMTDPRAAVPATQVTPAAGTAPVEAVPVTAEAAPAQAVPRRMPRAARRSAAPAAPRRAAAPSPREAAMPDLTMREEAPPGRPAPVTAAKVPAPAPPPAPASPRQPETLPFSPGCFPPAAGPALDPAILAAAARPGSQSGDATNPETAPDGEWTEADEALLLKHFAEFRAAVEETTAILAEARSAEQKDFAAAGD